MRDLAVHWDSEIDNQKTRHEEMKNYPQQMPHVSVVYLFNSRLFLHTVITFLIRWNPLENAPEMPETP